MFNYLEKQSTARLEKQIDAGSYATDQLLEIKIPLKVSYTASTDYGPSYGETEYNGQHYRYVKSKVQLDTLYLLCIPHTEKDQLMAMKSDFLKQMNDQPNNPSPGKTATLKLILSEFVPEKRYTVNVIAQTVSLLHFLQNSTCSSQCTPLTGEQPPEMFS